MGVGVGAEDCLRESGVEVQGKKEQQTDSLGRRGGVRG